MRVQCLGGELQTLLQHKLIEVGQQRGVEANAVFHHQNHLHTSSQVVGQVHLVLDEFDDGEQQFRIAQPAEHILESREVLVYHAASDAVAERCENHDGQCRKLVLDATGDVEHIVVVRSWHTDDEVELRLPYQSGGFFLRGSTEETRWIAKAQLGIFVKNLFIHTPIVLQHERIIGIGDDEHVEHTSLHQIHKLRLAQRRVFIECLFHISSCLKFKRLHVCTFNMHLAVCLRESYLRH